MNPVRYLNLQNQCGTVATGNIADLVLLDDNPLTNISNMQHIQTVIQHGKLYNKAVLNKMPINVKSWLGMDRNLKY